MIAPADGSGIAFRFWNYGDLIWIHVLGGTPDANKCVVSGTAVTSAPYFLTRAQLEYKDWIALYVRTPSGTPSRVPVDVTIVCPEVPR